MSSLKKSGWFKKRSVAERAAIIGGVFSIIGAVIAILLSTIFNIFQSYDSELHLVDINFLENDELIKLDIKVRNKGEKVSFLKRAEFEIERIWQLTPIVTTMGYRSPSHNYDILLSTSKVPYSISKSISQNVNSNSVDRFTFTLSTDKPKGGYIFLLIIKLIYDEDNESLKSPNLMFVTGEPDEYNPREFWKHIDSQSLISHWDLMIDEMKKNTAKNKQIIRDIDKIEAIKSECLKRLAHDIREVSIENISEVFEFY